MIKSFASKNTEKVFLAIRVKRWSYALQIKARDKLALVHVAGSLIDLLTPPSNRLEKLSGDREGQYSIRVNVRWRICFEWDRGHAYRVEIVDYHK